jgi:glycosyltransferase involved in cell wall biosynthesis/cellulose synthase/poly-beta-1,6-N-acetylglucosamine synthase-like glycosyltransferase/O-antigen/teichoic acid export membrane protein
MQRLSVIIPTLNEAENIHPLLSRLSRALNEAEIVWEAIFIDDHSSDDTVSILKSKKQEFPIEIFLKQGKRGKAYSLLEGFDHAQYEYVAMLDADLQYPPEALPQMFRMLEEGAADIVVANRREKDTAFLRRLVSRSFSLVFGKFLHGLDCDVQTGMKIFRKKILHDVKLDPTPWTFDLEFLLSARNYGYVIGSVDIVFAERTAGESKIKFFKAVSEIGWNAIQLRLKGRPPLLIHPETKNHMIGAGVAHNRSRFITHTTLHHSVSALTTFAPWQRNFGILTAIFLIVGLTIDPIRTGVVVMAFLSAVYFIDVFFNLGLILKSLNTPPEIESTESELRSVPDKELPVYSILCPLYKESHILPGFVAAIERIEWPKDKLDVLLLLEENDPETVTAAKAMRLPRHFRIVVVPHSMPKTKPKACNYGLSLSKGEYVVIYDAEDIPDPWQLRKAYFGFRKSGPEVQCLQAKLNYFNPEDNLLTRFFTAEYSLWFDIILVGLQTANTSIPLGGTSNHFRRSDLLAFEGWDPFNVTEDCDLGMRLFKRGGRTAVIDSVTLEEANSHVRNWLRQRSRWIKGYMQTYLVHMRHPAAFFREQGMHALIFQLVVGGKIAFLFINPILWVTTIAYFTLYAYVGPTIQALFPSWVFYMAAISLVFGNFLYIYYYMIGCAKRGHWHLIKYVFLVPLYWVLGSIAASVALYELLVKPHYWQKTTHGLHTAAAIRKERRLALIGVPAAAIYEFSRQVVRIISDFSGRLRTKTVSMRKKSGVSKGTSGKDKSAASSKSAPHQMLAWMKRILPNSVYEFIFSSKGFFIGALVFSNFINFLFNAFLGRMLSFEDLALVTLISTIWFLAIVVMSAFSSTINYRSAYLLGAKGRGAVEVFFRKTMRRALGIALGFSFVWVIASPFLTDFFQADRILTLFLFTPVFAFGILMSGCRGLLQGLYHFSSIAALFVGESVIKFGIAGILIAYDLTHWVYLAIPLSIVLTALLSYLVVLLIVRDEGSRTHQLIEKPEPFPKSFFSSSIIFNFSAAIFLSADIFLVNHYLEPIQAGQYALLALIGKMIYFLGSLPNSFTITLVGRHEGLKRKTDGIFFLIYGLVLFTVACGVLLLGVFGSFTTPLLFGEKAYSILPWLLPYTLALGLFTLSGVVVSYHLAKRHHAFSIVSIALSLGMVAGIVISHGSVEDIVRVVFAVSVSGWFVLTGLHFFYRDLRFVWRAARDFAGVFFNGFPRKLPILAPGKKRILIFNWRDTKHKFSGGAEVYVHEIAKEWVKDGNHVTLFSGNDGQGKRYEMIDGVQIVRRGGFYLVYVWAFFYYILRFRGKYDVIVDCENGIPFFTPLYVRKPIFCLLHHVHQDVFYHSLPRPLAWLASTLEKDVMPFFYKEVKFITVSESSRREMESFGLGKKGIIVMHPGVDFSTFSDILVERTPHPTVLYLGRLKGYKSVNVLIRAFRIVVTERPEARLIIAGSGEEESYLKRLVKELRLTPDQVHFTGQVDDEQKIQLLQSSWMLVNPSFMEGWGIVAIEASACGTPVIASDVPGLRDSVRNEQTGYLVPYGDVSAFAEKILLIIRDRELRDGMSINAKEWAVNFDWLKTSKGFLAYMTERHD